MQRGKNNTGERTDSTNLKVVVVENDQAKIEREIEKNIKKIRSLIHKLRPSERQKYFNGLLSHILQEPTEVKKHSSKGNETPAVDKDYSALSLDELQLIQELSVKVEQLYRTMDHDPS